MTDRKQALADLAQISQFKRGKVWCTHCGRVEQVNAVSATTGGGWPKCCGYTMTIDSPQERTTLAKLKGESHE